MNKMKVFKFKVSNYGIKLGNEVLDSCNEQLKISTEKDIEKTINDFIIFKSDVKILVNNVDVCLYYTITYRETF